MPRAITISDEQIAQVEKLARYLTQEQIADVLGIASRTLRNKMTDDPRLRAAYKKGRATGAQQVVGWLLRAARKGNVTAQIFYLKCQAGWRETDPKQIDVSELSKLSDRELEKEKRRLGLVR